MLSTPCPICNGARHKVVARYGGPLNTPARNVLCLDCGFLYRDPRWDDEEAAAFYRHLSDYYRFVYRRDRLSAEGDEYDTALASARLTKLLQIVRPPARVLDVGAGSGAFVRECGGL